MPRTMRRPATLAMAVLVGACAFGSPTTHTLFLAGEEPGMAELQVTVTDESGHLRDVSQHVGWPPGQQPDGPVWSVPGEPQKVRIAWTGGACDTDVQMRLQNQGNGFRIAMTTSVKDGPCDAMGIERSVVMTFDRPVAPALVTIIS
jgi:hypothetical protein